MKVVGVAVHDHVVARGQQAVPCSLRDCMARPRLFFRSVGKMQATPETPDRWWRPLSGGDRRALALIVGLPTLLFALPALLGHPAIAQDNLIQNFPFASLTGQQIDSGHLPLLNPLADSGAPLLGGMNAGSFFPLTSLFAVLPAIMAWVLNLIAVYAAAALGMFALLRWHGLRTSLHCCPRWSTPTPGP